MKYLHYFDKEDDNDNLLNNLDMEFKFEKNLENNIVPDEQSNNVLIPDANIHLVVDIESELNGKVNNVQLDQELTKKRNCKENKRYGVYMKQKIHTKLKAIF